MTKKKKQDHKTGQEPEEMKIQLEAEELEAQTCQSEEELEEEDLASDYRALQEDYRELDNKYIRLVAEYDNFRKRTRKEKDNLYNDAVSDVLEAWLPVLDNLDRALEAGAKLEGEAAKSMQEGVELIRKQALETMAKLGIEEIDCCGKEFDPELHNAVMHVEDADLPENSIKEVFQKGYKKGDRVIRHSSVLVAN